MSHSIMRSQALSPTLHRLNNTPTTCFRVPLHVVHPSQALAARFFIYSLKLTLLAFHLIVRSQALSLTLLYLNIIPPTCFYVPAHVVRQSRAIVARFLIYSLKPIPLVSCLIVRSQALCPTLTHLNITPSTWIQVPQYVVHQNRAMVVRFLIYSIKPIPLCIAQSRSPRLSTPA